MIGFELSFISVHGWASTVPVCNTTAVTVAPDAATLTTPRLTPAALVTDIVFDDVTTTVELVALLLDGGQYRPFLTCPVSVVYAFE